MRSTWNFLRRSIRSKIFPLWLFIVFVNDIGRSEWFMHIAEFTTRTVLDPETTPRLEDNPSPSASPPQGTVWVPYSISLQSVGDWSISISVPVVSTTTRMPTFSNIVGSIFFFYFFQLIYEVFDLFSRFVLQLSSTFLNVF